MNLKSLRGSVRLLRAFKVAAIVAAITVSWQPCFSGLFRPTPLRAHFLPLKTRAYLGSRLSRATGDIRAIDDPLHLTTKFFGVY